MLLRALVVLTLVTALLLSLEFHPHRVEIRIVDGASGRPVRALIGLTDALTGEARLPPGGRRVARAASADEFAAGFAVRPGTRSWIGPALPMIRATRTGRSGNYAPGPSIPFWDSPYATPVDGELSIDLPAGTWILEVARGTEYVPVRVTFSTDDRRVEVRLERWIDLAAEGWYSGDVHVHHPTETPEQKEFLLRHAEATDLRMVNTLAMGHHLGVDFPQGGFGPGSRATREGTWVIPGQEEPRVEVGHILGLNLSSLVRDLDHCDRLDLAVRAIRSQPGALAGYAHMPLEEEALGRALAWLLPTTGVDFAEGLQFGRSGAAEYFRYLDLGFQFGLAAGSDTPWGSTMGEVRTYVRVAGGLDPDRWFEGLKRGRSFVTNGPAIELTADQAGPGDHLRVTRGQIVTLRARARSHESIGRPLALTLFRAGEIHEALKNSASEQELEFESIVRVDSSQWIAAQVECEDGGLALTSALYLEIDGEPTWSPRRIPGALAEIKRKLDGLPYPPVLLRPAQERYAEIEHATRRR